MTLTFTKTLGLLFALLLMGWSPYSFSMYCAAVTGSNAPVISIDAPIKVPATVKAGTVIWRSATSTYRQLRCDSSESGLKVNIYGDNANFYWDPNSVIPGLDKSLEVGITYMNIDYPLYNGYGLRIGPALTCTPFCNPGETNQNFLRRNVYIGSNLDVTFQVYVKATGLPPPASGKITNSGTYLLFKVGGDKELNAVPPGNFGGLISGLNNISFISCKPTIRVAGTSGSTLSFGSISQRNAAVGKIEKQLPFSINVDMSGADNGQACAGTTMQATFSTTFPMRDGTTLMPASDSGFGIVLSQAASPNTPIVMNKVVNLGLVNGTVVQNRFIAGLKWLSTKPKVGPFNASATVDVTFK